MPFILARYVITVSDAVGELFVAVAEMASLALPIAAAIAITRRHLFGIDRLINRTIVYALLIGVMGGLYAAVVWLFQRLFISVTGQVSDAPLFFAVFLIAAAFTPVRKSLDGMVDRWARSSTPAHGDAPGDASTPGTSVADARRTTAAARAIGALAPLDVDDPEVLRVATAVLALRRLEARLGADPGGDHPWPLSPVPDVAALAPTAEGQGTPLAIGTDGHVACPMSHARVPITSCLGCPHLRALFTTPPVIGCGFALVS
jgi:hypothetical protein